MKEKLFDYIKLFQKSKWFTPQKFAFFFFLLWKLVFTHFIEFNFFSGYFFWKEEKRLQFFTSMSVVLMNFLLNHLFEMTFGIIRDFFFYSFVFLLSFFFPKWTWKLFLLTFIKCWKEVIDLIILFFKVFSNSTWDMFRWNVKIKWKWSTL